MGNPIEPHERITWFRNDENEAILLHQLDRRVSYPRAVRMVGPLDTEHRTEGSADSSVNEKGRTNLPPTRLQDPGSRGESWCGSLRPPKGKGRLGEDDGRESRRLGGGFYLTSPAVAR